MKRFVLVFCLLLVLVSIVSAQDLKTPAEEWFSMNYDERYRVCLSYVVGFIDGLRSAIPTETMLTKPNDRFYTRLIDWEDTITSSRWRREVVASVNDFYRSPNNQDKPVMMAIFFYTISLIPKRQESGQ